MEDYIKAQFAQAISLPESEVFDNDMTLDEIIVRSSALHNSVDLMEAFAKTANRLKKDHGVRIKLPAFALDTPISQVLASFLEQIDSLKAVG